MEFAEKIRNLRKRSGLSQVELAERLGVSQNLVSAWERGSNVPRLPQLAAVARALKTTADYLVDQDDERTLDEVAAELKVREVAARIGWDETYWRLIAAPNEKTPAAPVGERPRPDEGPARVVREMEMEGPYGPIVPHGKGRPEDAGPEKPNGLRKPSSRGKGEPKPAR